MKICDAGSSYTKILDTKEGAIDIIPSKDLLPEAGLTFDAGTGHLGHRWTTRYVNELCALAKGAIEVIDEEDFLVLDVGARDTKYIEFRDRDLKKMDWNSSCGSNMGFTVEVLGRYYNVDFGDLKPSQESIPVACGLLGVERVFDEINSGLSPKEAIAKFIHGIARATFLFIGQPKRLYLSGGFCLNECFIQTLSRYCEVIPIGRDVILKGVQLEAKGLCA